MLRTGARSSWTKFTRDWYPPARTWPCRWSLRQSRSGPWCASAVPTQKPIEDVAKFLVGAGGDDSSPCSIVDEGAPRRMDLGVEIPVSALDA